MAFPNKRFALVLCIILLGILAVPEASSRALVFEPNDNSMNISQIFEKWMEKHGRVYSNISEKEKRFAIFKANFEHMEKFNSQRKESFTLGINAFSDLTHEEIHERYGNTLEMPKITRSSNSSFRYSSIEYEDLPKNWDWRTKGAVTKVKHQGSECGCCWAFSTAAAVEALPPIFKNLTPMDLSVQQLIECSKDFGTHGCTNGKTINALRYVKEYGLVTEDRYPYQQLDDHPCDTNLQSNPDVKIRDYEWAPEFDEIALAKAVYHQPVTIMHATSREFYRYAGGVFTDSAGVCTRNEVSHSSLLIGYGTTPDGLDYWLLKNSWGESWGEQGYMRLLRSTKKKRGQGVCKCAGLALFPINDV